MATDNKQKVLIRSMSIEELENYLVNNDLNGKIIPQNENTWHQNYDTVKNDNNLYCFATILSNNSSRIYSLFFIKRIIKNINTKELISSLLIIKNNFLSISINGYTGIQTFRPLIEYKE